MVVGKHGAPRGEGSAGGTLGTYVWKDGEATAILRGVLGSRQRTGKKTGGRRKEHILGAIGVATYKKPATSKAWWRALLLGENLKKVKN